MISVIIPVYNVQSYLQRCLNSLYASTYNELEIICVDDGSDDGSFKILQHQKDSRVVVMKKDRGGVSSARNVGLKKATGDYIAFIDSDDWIHPQYFEMLVNEVETADIVQCGYTPMWQYEEAKTVEEMFEVRHLHSSEAIKDHYTKSYVWGKLFRRECLKGIEFNERISVGEDKLFLIEVLSQELSLNTLSCPLYYYFMRQGSLVHNEKACYEMLPLAEVFLEQSVEKRNVNMLYEAYMGLFSYRYLTMFDEKNEKSKRKLNECFGNCWKTSRKIMPFRKRFLLNGMIVLPQIYRILRIVGDRTMLDWERKKKDERRTR